MPRIENERTYAGTGVDYNKIDPWKRLALEAALPTADNLSQHGFSEVRESRGESAYVVDVGPFMLAFVEEGLGTKNKVAEDMMALARAMHGLEGRTYHGSIMVCNAAMALNDLSTVGAAPFVSMMHLAAGDAKFFTNEKRNKDIVDGHAEACDLAGCVWGGGESPMLRDIIFPGTAVYAGSATGVINPKSNILLGSKIRPKDAIIIFYSSGIHANGLTLCRDIEELLDKGYMTELPSGITYGEALLEPTIIYAPLVNACAHLSHYAINITGHGWRKFMRAQQSFRYIIKNIPTPQEIFGFIMEHGKVSLREAYGNLNMGAGFALIVPPENVEEVLRIAGNLDFTALDAGYVEASEKKEVVIEPLDITFNEEELNVR
ncbi:MAG: AIR synthase related protein [Candidatus Moranbacteria bacterium]|nr:AIR synthase related protein [Candidatus Moranbacteria bacterium]